MNGKCIADSLVNAIDRLVGRKAAKAGMGELRRLLGEAISAEDLRSSTKADLKKRVRALSSVKELARVLHKMSVRVEMHKIPTEIKAASKWNEISIFSWLVEHSKGIWLVRLFQSGVVDHCVCVDASDARILDRAEEYPIEVPFREQKNS